MKPFSALAFYAVICLATISQPNAVADEPALYGSPPGTFIFLVDVSGTMLDPPSVAIQPRLTKQSKLEHVQQRLADVFQELAEGTRVIVVTFDHETHEICDMVLNSSADRESLLNRIDGIASRKGTTSLWSSIHEQLSRADRLISQGADRVRLVLYSDGDDTEKSPTVNHESIIKKFGHLIDQELQLSFVTIGYDLGATTRQALEAAGVRFTKELTPVRAVFSLSRRQATVGQVVDFVDKSSGRQIDGRNIDWGDNHKDKLDLGGSRVGHTYKSPGTYLVRYAVTTSAGQRDTCETTVVVRSAPIAPITIQLEKQAIVGEAVLAIAEPNVAGASYKWSSLEGIDIQSHGNVASIVSDKPGSFEVAVRVTNANSAVAATARRRLRVVAPKLGDLKLSINEPDAVVGQPVVVSPSFIADGLSFDYLTSDGQTSSSPCPTFRFKNPGRHEITARITDKWGQSTNAEMSVAVCLPSELPDATFNVLSDQLAKGVPIALSLSSDPPPSTIRWLVDGAVLSTERTLAWTPKRYGKHIITCKIEDEFGRIAQSSESITIPKPAPPKSKFTVDANGLTAGDQLRLSDLSGGDIAEVEYRVSGIRNWRVPVEANGKRERVFTIPTTKPGKLTITQKVIGPGGRDESAVVVEVKPRWRRVRVDFLPSVQLRDGAADVRYENRVVGDYSRLEFLPGDGSERVVLDNGDDVVHRFSPGTWQPQIVVHAPKESNLPPVAWDAPTVRVPHPTPLWVKALAVSIPFAAMSVAGVVVFRRRAHAQAYSDSLQSLHGELTVEPVNAPLEAESFCFDGSSAREEFSLADGTRISARAMVDEQFGTTDCQIEVHDASNELIGSAAISSGDEQVVDRYRLSFLA